MLGQLLMIIHGGGGGLQGAEVCMCGYFWCSFFGFRPCRALRFYVIKKKKTRIQQINLFLPFSPPPSPQDWGREKLELVRGMWGGGRLSPPLPLL